MEVEHSGDEHSSILTEEQPLPHFSHKHPLSLIKEHKHDDDDDGDDQILGSCNGCGEPILSGSMYYSCSILCEYNLHKLCAKLPPEMEHPEHPKHPLILRVAYSSTCDVCDYSSTNFTYSCSRCNFNMDIICASLMERKIQHPSHIHPLTPMRKLAWFLCDACGKIHQVGFSYFCTTCCFFWIHRDCASLPSTLNRGEIHRHPLTLAHSLPSQYSVYYSFCEICYKTFWENKQQWVYHCVRCRYLAHVGCATSKTEPFMSILLPRGITDGKIKVEDPDPNMLHLPPSDGLVVGLISRFIKLMNQGENERAEVSHHHALSLFDVESSNKDASCSEIKFSLVNDMKNDEILCEGCVQPISVPFYRCKTGCNYFLHKCCAELPSEVKCPCHPKHPLTLLPKSLEFFGLFFCRLCDRFSNGFAYGCRTCEFYIDVICASLPGTVKHESHADHLLVFKDKVDGRCNACFRWVRFGFSCDTCYFNLHTRCALQPLMVRHRYDEHPFTRTSSLVQDFPDDEYYCEVCEEELDPKQWFYHCGDCNQYMHADCIGQLQKTSNIKFGGTLNIKSHPHSLTFVPGNIWNRCKDCGQFTYDDYEGMFECSQCKFVLCYICAKLSM